VSYDVVFGPRPHPCLARPFLVLCVRPGSMALPSRWRGARTPRATSLERDEARSGYTATPPDGEALPYEAFYLGLFTPRRVSLTSDRLADTALLCPRGALRAAIRVVGLPGSSEKSSRCPRAFVKVTRLRTRGFLGRSGG
jgi:hypothetical protein